MLVLMPRRPPDAAGGDPAVTTEKSCSVHEGVQRLVQLLPRVMRGLRRGTPAADPTTSGLGARHRSALALVLEQEIAVGSLAAALGLTLPTASGLVADLERVGFVARFADPADRRRTLITVAPGRRQCVEQWLSGASAPVVRVLEQLSPEERSAFVKAMGLLDAELSKSPSYGPLQD